MIYCYNLFYSTLSLRIHESCELSNPSHINFIPPFAQHFFDEIHVRISNAMQLIFIESSDDRFSAGILQ